LHDFDPPTEGLNTTRGKSFRATLALAVRLWRENVASPLRQGLDSIVRASAIGEENAGVRSGFGLYLPQLVTFNPELWEELKDSVLPATEQRLNRFAAVWGTYVSFNPPYTDLAERLNPYYEASVRLQRDLGSGYLNSTFDRTLNHLLALSLKSEEFYDGWGALAVAALGVADAEQAAQSFRSLSHALGSEDSALQRDLVMKLATRRLRDIRASRTSRSEEAKAAFSAVVETGMPLSEIGGLLLDLARIGGVPDANELLEYLLRPETNLTQLGSDLLLIATESGVFSGWYRDSDRLRDVIRIYSAQHPLAMWEIVNILGSQGVLAIEPEALELRGRI